MTSVHTNRTLQRLRRDGLIESRGRKLSILDVDGLRRAAGFDPTYLRVKRRDPADLKLELESNRGLPDQVRVAQKMVNPTGLTRRGSHVSDPKI